MKEELKQKKKNQLSAGLEKNVGNKCEKERKS